jgi:hypothetical protein
MKSAKMLTILVVSLGLMVWPVEVSEAAPMSTAFTYQGRLIDANSVAEGQYDFEFKLYDSPADGNQLGSIIDVNELDVIDGYFTVALDFNDVGVFNGDARWLQIGVRPGGFNDPCEYTVMEPRTELTPTPYALQTRGIFVDEAGNVGIGTTEPGTKLHVESGGAKAVFGKNTASGGIGVEGQARNFSGGGVGVYGKSYSTDGIGVFGIAAMSTGKNYGVYGQSQSPDGWAGYFHGHGHFSGNVGIGTTEPGAKLDIIGDLATRNPGSTPNGSQILLSSPQGNPGLIIQLGDGAGNRLNQWVTGVHSDESYYIQERGASGSQGTKHMVIASGGNVGIGTTSPKTKLHIEGGSDASLGGGGFLVTGSESGTNMVIDDNEIIARNNGNPSKLYLNKGSGNVVVSVLEIIGGSDLAEPFEVAGAESIEPGMVVAIDSEHPGQLRIADKAYDRKVAGIVSGANGINPGMTMSQEGTVADGFLLVALTGRVYAWADASNGLIEPGDLLTTSDIPGHAMKVTDYSRAQGAILGKAMSSLDQGQGLVLVLVTLQ